MAKRQNLTRQMHLIMKQQAAYIGTKRHELKKETGHAQYDKVTSISSNKTHVSRLKRFETYLTDEGIRNVSDIGPYHVEEYMHYMHAQGFKHDPERGYSHKYLANTLTSINHLLTEQHKPYRCADFGLKGYEGRKHNKDGLQRPDVPDKYDEQVELAKAFGLRRHEIEGIGTKSFFKTDDKVYVATSGKGGRPRVIEVRADFQSVMVQRYADYIRSVDSKEEIPADKESVKILYRKGKDLYADKVPNKYSLHIYRSEYANQMFNQIMREGSFEPQGVEYTINGVTADKAVFKRLTENLGHSRIYVLGAYLGVK